MSGRQHLDQIMGVYNKHFDNFKAELREMNLKIPDRAIVWSLVLQAISRQSYEESQKHQKKKV